MDTRTSYSSKYLAASDLDGGRYTVTIKNTSIVTMKDGTEKVALHFVGPMKSMPLNRTNIEKLWEAYGFDSDAWIGKQVIVYATTCDFQGRTVDCVRLSVPAQTKKVTAQKMQEPAPTDDLDSGPIVY
jgi:hypothetical protein